MKPDPTTYNPNPDYLRELVDKSGLSQNKVAESIGVATRTFRDYLNGNHKSKAPYPVQFALESLVS
jgi:transcriptional regulator with XRE-family HTH domain